MEDGVRNIGICTMVAPNIVESMCYEKFFKLSKMGATGVVVLLAPAIPSARGNACSHHGVPDYSPHLRSGR